ncbi:hypothetical protein [Streptomyces sp. YIM 130001]|uniref:hypothetical protein n=1 Tax=Streptomyces sp. YIM 130001 TaxID=2259644 RepID=UPI0013C42781|nr:hypothetical protein [Streptomyces sp. YIM 130001]
MTTLGGIARPWDSRRGRVLVICSLVVTSPAAGFLLGTRQWLLAGAAITLGLACFVVVVAASAVARVRDGRDIRASPVWRQGTTALCALMLLGCVLNLLTSQWLSAAVTAIAAFAFAAQKVHYRRQQRAAD